MDINDIECGMLVVGDDGDTGVVIAIDTIDSTAQIKTGGPKWWYSAEDLEPISKLQLQTELQFEIVPVS